MSVKIQFYLEILFIIWFSKIFIFFPFNVNLYFIFLLHFFFSFFWLWGRGEWVAKKVSFYWGGEVNNICSLNYITRLYVYVWWKWKGARKKYLDSICWNSLASVLRRYSQSKNPPKWTNSLTLCIVSLTNLATSDCLKSTANTYWRIW